MKRLTILLAFALSIALVEPTSAGVVFSTFIQGSDIASVTGQQSTISITYAGNKFVGGLYFGPNNNQLYQSDLNGGNVKTFGSAISGAGGEVVVGASLGLDGFAKGDIFAGSQFGTDIYHFSNDGLTQSLFTTLPTGGDIRQIFFDPGSSFGGAMIVTTGGGDIYTVDSAGTPTLLAQIGEDTEGLDIAPSTWGPYAGQLLVASEGSGALRFVDNAGNVTYSGVSIQAAETVSFVPANLGASGNPLEGFYVANYPVDIQKAGASQFSGLLDHVIVTSEDGGNARVWDLQYMGNGIVVNNGVTGNLPNQSEDGIFVTAERIQDVSVPEPSAVVMWSLLASVIGITWMKQRKASVVAA